MNTESYYVSNGKTTTGPYTSRDRADRRAARWSTETDDDWAVVTPDQVFNDPDIPFPAHTTDEEAPTLPVNYRDIRTALELVLDMEAPDVKSRVLDSLDDAIGNNADDLVFPSQSPDTQSAPHAPNLTVTLVTENGTTTLAGADFYTIEEHVVGDGNTQLHVFETPDDPDPTIYDHASIVDVTVNTD